VFLFGTAFTIVILGGHIPDFLNLPSLVLIIIPFVAILTITRSFKLFGTGFRTALFPKKEIEEDIRKQAAMLFRLMSKTAIIASAIVTLISLINMMMDMDVYADDFSRFALANFAASFVPLLYGLIMSVFIFEPIAYILRKTRT
jgi:flagellar motor component MotA